MRTSIVAAVIVGTAALIVGTGTATAHTAPSVVGMSQQSAVELLAARNVPYTITNRSGNLSGHCAVTEQRDKGNRIVVEHVYDHGDKEFDRVETEVWRGIGLTIVCR